MGASLGAGQRMDLVDDHGLDSSQALAGLRRQHQVERLGRRDQDVRWTARDLASFLCGRVTGADADGRVGRGHPQAFCGEGDALEWTPQVLVDVDGQGPQR